MLQNYLNDQVIQDISRHLGSLFKLLNVVSSTDLVDILEKSIQDPILDKVMLKSPRIGIGGLFKASRDEDFQPGVGLVVGLLSALGRASESRTTT